MAPVVSPPTLYGHAMAYDSESDRVILFGGDTSMIYGIITNGTWAYDFNTNTWTDMAPAVGPPVREGHAMAYDSGSDRMIASGGLGTNSNDTWVYDFQANTWMQQASSASPPGGTYQAMAYDSGSDRVIMFGGYGGATFYLGGTWACDLEGNAWTNMDAPSPLSAPGALTAMSGNAHVTLSWQATTSNGGLPFK